MVRTKDKPSHINVVEKKQVYRENFTANCSENSFSNCSAETAPLICDEIDSEDEGYIPTLTYQRKPSKARASQKSVNEIKNTKKKVIDYGLFEKVLENCSLCIKIESEINSANLHCLFGEIAIEIVDFSEECFNLTETFWLYVSKETNKSAIYFEWCDDDSPTTKKSKKLKANKFKYFHVAGCLDFDLWSGISIQRYFQLIFHKLENNSLYMKVYFLKSGIVKLEYSSEFNNGSKNIAAVCSYFYGIKPLNTLEEEYNHNHDIDQFYKAIKNAHCGIEYNNIDVQHSKLIPKLRPYQKEAVKWMLHQERIERKSILENLHPLYVEIVCKDNTVLYYNYFGRFFVSNKPLEISSCPGGILADEMGLGKTVEVLACILCHNRETIPASVDNYNEQNIVNFSHNNEQDKYSVQSTFSENMEILSSVSDKHSPDKECLKEENNSNLKVSPEVLEPIPEMDDKNEVIQMTGRQTKRKAANRISYSFLDPLLESNQDSDKESEISHSKRRASRMIDLSYTGSSNEFDFEYGSKAKKRKQNLIPKRQTFNIENEISQNSILMTIEKVILEKCWDGIMKGYKTDGSHKEFRKFLKQRKKNPYYLMTLREKLEVLYLNSLAEYSASKRAIPRDPYDKANQKTFFECVCGEEEKVKFKDLFCVQCSVCSSRQHAECVQFNQNDISKRRYICPHCWTLEPLAVSGATLIVTPSSISHQWVEEIKKHIKEKSLKLFVYNGVSCHGFMQPYNLAFYDIVITTYETLRKEVDLPHITSQTGRRFRFPKRFMVTPSPLSCVEWWRVCLDEAQMVECTTNKTAEMALRLSAANRWCITGTPIQKTVNDLQGLLMFLGVEPYCVPQWWQRCLYYPYCRGDEAPLHTLMSQYMWRNSKSDVIHQLDIPSQSVQIHWLNFTQVEEHFYSRLHADCSSEALRKINKFSNQAIKLSSLDKKTLSSLLQPLLKLRQACDHPRIVRGLFVGLNRKTLTMEQLLENLIKKTQLEVEDTHRIIVASLNGLAGLDIIKEDFLAAIDKYREVLRSVEDHKETFKTDSLQQLHTLHNLAQLMQTKPEGFQPTLRDESLSEEAKSIKDKYLKLYPQKTAEAETECDQNSITIEELKKKFLSKIEWWIFALESLGSEFVMEVRQELMSIYPKFKESQCLLYPIHTKSQLLQLLKLKMKMLNTQRKLMINSIKELSKVDPALILVKAIDCHLRSNDEMSNTCQLCTKHVLLEEYEENLFFMKEFKHNRYTDRSKETEIINPNLNMYQMTRQGNWGQGEIERVLRYLQTKSLGRVESDVYEDSQKHLLLLQAMKKEFKNFRILWRTIYDHVSAMDEVNMATLRFRLRLPGEELPPAKKEPMEKLQKLEEAPRYLLENIEIPQQEMKLKSEKLVAQNDMHVKLGRLLYLNHLKKVDFGKKGTPNPEPCPVCQSKLGFKWKVLLCGHSYCIDCLAIIIQRIPLCFANASIKCPVCRQPTRINEIAHVDMHSEEEQEDIKVAGSLSTKISGIVRVMLKIKASDPEAKVLIFSSWNEVLEVIADGLAQNGITHRVLLTGKKFQTTLSSFKSEKEITALIMPISSGANGLNLVEAHHVILVEPILNPAVEVQAIGRIHRIGQKNATVVHRFLIHNTIEERMYNILHPKYAKNSAEDNSVTIEDLHKLFIKNDDIPEEPSVLEAINEIIQS